MEGWKTLGAVLLLMGFGLRPTQLYSSPRPVISLAVFNHAEAPDNALKRAERHVKRILTDAGVNTTWMDGASFRPAMRSPTSNETCAYTVLVTLRKQLLHTPKQPSKLDLGVVFVESDRQDRGGSAFISWEHIRQLSHDRNQDVGAVLGHVIVHEIGHLLLPAPAHSQFGIMRSDWNVNDLRRIEQGSMLFTRSQATLISSKASSAARACD